MSVSYLDRLRGVLVQQDGVPLEDAGRVSTLDFLNADLAYNSVSGVLQVDFGLGASFPTIATDRLVGRDAAGSGSATEIALASSLAFTGSNSIGVATNGVALSHLATVATATLLGRVTAATGNVEALTATQATSLLDVGTETLKGLVAPPVTATGKFYRDDHSWATPSASFSPSDPGDDGKLAYADSGAAAFSANITTDGTSLTYGAAASAATSGFHRFANNVINLITAKTVGGTTLNLVGGIDTSDIWRIGDPTNLAALYADVKAGGNHTWWIGGTARLALTSSKLTVTPGSLTSGSAESFFHDLAGATYTGITTFRLATWGFNKTFSMAAGSYGDSSAMRIREPIIAGDSATAAFTGIAATLAIQNAPVASTNATIVNPLALWIEAGAIGFGSGSATARSGLIRAPNNTSVVVGRNAAGDNDVAMLSMGTSDRVFLGDGNQAAKTVLTAKTGGSHEWWINNSSVASLSATTLALAHGVTGVSTLTGNILNSEVDDGNSGTSKTIDFSNSGPAHKLTQTGNCTLTFTAPAQHKWVQIKFIQDGTGGRTLTFPASVKWTTGSAPTWITTPAAVNIATFWWDGVNYWGVGAVGFA